MNILLGVTGSVATTLTPQLIAALKKSGHDVQLIATASSRYFFSPETVERRGTEIWFDNDEWRGKRYVRGQEIPHIELRKWADVLVIAPCSANTLAKLAHGLCDNLLTCVARAWDRTKPIVLAPAMNTMMWEHPATREQLATLHRWYPQLTVVDPIAKTLACGDTGIGAMALIPAIVAAVAATDDPYDMVE